MLRVGIAGLGAISGVHLRAIADAAGAELVAACDIDPEKRALAPGAAFYTDIAAMVERERLDCLHICLPHHLHALATLLAVQRRVHVFLEKPAALDTAELRTLLPVERDCGIKLGICLQNRYNPTTAALKQVIAQGGPEQFLGCKATVTWSRVSDYYDREPWRGRLGEAGGGVMLSQAIHTLDLLCYLFGDIAWVKGWCGNLLLEGLEVEDTAVAHMQFQSGAGGIFYGTVTHSFDSPVEIEAVFRNERYTLCNGALLRHSGSGVTQVAADPAIDGSKSYYGSGHGAAISAFYSAIIDDTPAYIHVEDCMESMRLIDGVVESARSGSRVELHR